MENSYRPFPDETAMFEEVRERLLPPSFYSEGKKPEPKNRRHEISLVPKYINRYANTTVVKWEDGTVTTVKLSSESPEQYSYYTAYLAALGKKLYGSTSALHHMVDTHTVSYINAQKVKEKNKRRENAKLQEERAHQRKVKAIMKRMKLEEEARNALEQLEAE